MIIDLFAMSFCLYKYPYVDHVWRVATPNQLPDDIFRRGDRFDVH